MYIYLYIFLLLRYLIVLEPKYFCFLLTQKNKLKTMKFKTKLTIYNYTSIIICKYPKIIIVSLPKISKNRSL